MKLVDINEHLNCYNYDNNKKPVIEQLRIAKSGKHNSVTTNNAVVFVMEGRLRYSFRDSPPFEAQKGELFFLPVGATYSRQALTQARIVIFRVHGFVGLCANYTVERLYRERNKKDSNDYEPENKHFGLLEVNARLWHFVDGICDCIEDGLKCRYWFDMKVQELFLLIRAYYPKEDIRGFLYPILSRDTAFSESVRKYWKDFKTVNELAAFMHMSPNQFHKRFTAVFGTTPHKWIAEGRAKIARHEITATNKQFKQIAIENGFSSDAIFTRFCKKMFGKSPTQLRGENVK